MRHLIFHICHRDAWQKAQGQKNYHPPSIEEEGFIHCSTLEQVVSTANLLFRGEANLLLLSIDPDKVGPEIKYENTTGGHILFPHIYGALNLDAVVGSAPFIANQDGYFELNFEE
ncbi:MAG: DUF952 domain-containing protein [Bacteroidota bacterium]